MNIPEVRIAPDWRGEDAFIVAGGTSIRPEDLEALRARPRAHVLVINSSYLAAPWAEVLFFADDRWIKRESKERPGKLAAFTGEILTIVETSKLERLRRLKVLSPRRHNGLATDRGSIVMERTSLQGALNICLHKAPRRIVLLGADNRDGAPLADGSPNIHHHDEYPWPRKHETWNVKAKQMAGTVEPLKRAGIEVINASLISTFPWWPKVDFLEWLKENPA